MQKKLINGDKELDKNLHNVANIEDLKQIGLLGMDFVGNDGASIHKNLGQTLTIKGFGTIANDFAGASEILMLKR